MVGAADIGILAVLSFYLSERRNYWLPIMGMPRRRYLRTISLRASPQCHNLRPAVDGSSCLGIDVDAVLGQVSGAGFQRHRAAWALIPAGVLVVALKRSCTLMIVNIPPIEM